MKKVLEEIKRERERQIAKGRNVDFDCHYNFLSELPNMAASLVVGGENDFVNGSDLKELKSRLGSKYDTGKELSYRQRLIRAAALMVAEIERYDNEDVYKAKCEFEKAISDAGVYTVTTREFELPNKKYKVTIRITK